LPTGDGLLKRPIYKVSFRAYIGCRSDLLAVVSDIATLKTIRFIVGSILAHTRSVQGGWYAVYLHTSIDQKKTLQLIEIIGDVPSVVDKSDKL
jgi:hypothetical protein